MTGMLNEIRYAVRGLARVPQFTIPAALTLALVIGANASIFSAVWGVLLKPLPFPNADRLVTIWNTAPGMDWDRIPMSLGTFEIYQEYGDLFESAGLYQGTTVNVTGDGAEPERVEAARVSRSVLPTLGLAPLLGRGFDEEEERPNGPKVAILGHGLWQDRFAGDRQVIGKTIRVNDAAHEIIGVLPERFTLSRHMWQPGTGTRLLLPLAREGARLDNFSYSAIARLKPGIDAGMAESTLKQAIERIREGLGDDEADFRALIDQGRLAPVVESLRGSVVRDLSQPLWLLLGTAAFVFLIACANVTNLFLVRAEARQKEMAVRAALGTGRGRLIGHYLAEAGLIALAGGVAGIALARLGLPALIRAAPPGIPRLDVVGIDPLVLVFTFAITLLAAVLLGIVPSIRLTRLDVLAMLSRSARGSTAGRDRNRARQMLVVVQTALALVLLIGSALMLRSFQKLRAVDPGFRAENTLTFRISLPATTYAEAERVNVFHGELLDRLRTLPGVEAVGATSDLPLACCSSADHVVEGRPVAPGEPPLFLSYSSVIEGYFEAMGIPIIAGRAFDTRDRATDGHAIIVSDVLARRFWPDSDPIGKRVRRAWSDTTGRGGWRTIVGVAGNVRAEGLEADGLEKEPTAMVYYPAASTPVAGQARSVAYVIRARQPETLAPLVRRQVGALDPSLPITATQTLERVVADSMAPLSFTMLALVVAAAIALFLGAIGLYGVTSYLVAQRTNEIGIRIALGARPGQVRSMVVRQGLRLAAFGLALGFVGALLLTRVLEGLLFGTEPTDPATFAAMLAFLTAIALLASYLPARRASRIDPAASLKVE